MENKKTTELIDLLDKLSEEDLEKGKYEKIMEELRGRELFIEILGEDWDTSLPAVWKEIKELQNEVKLLKRHKHEEKSGDVMVRI